MRTSNRPLALEKRVAFGVWKSPPAQTIGIERSERWRDPRGSGHYPPAPPATCVVAQRIVANWSWGVTELLLADNASAPARKWRRALETERETTSSLHRTHGKESRRSLSCARQRKKKDPPTVRVCRA